MMHWLIRTTIRIYSNLQAEKYSFASYYNKALHLHADKCINALLGLPKTLRPGWYPA